MTFDLKHNIKNKGIESMKLSTNTDCYIPRWLFQRNALSMFWREYWYFPYKREQEAHGP